MVSKENRILRAVLEQLGDLEGFLQEERESPQVPLKKPGKCRELASRSRELSQVSFGDVLHS